MNLFNKIMFSFWIVCLVACGNGDLLDDINPQVSATAPSDGASSVAINRVIVASFDEDITESTVTTTTFTLTDENGNGIAGTVNVESSNRIAVFAPSSNLTVNTTYTASLETGIEDSEGNNLENQTDWTFTTGLTEDVTAPSLETTTPEADDNSVARDSNVTITFSEPMNPLLLTTSNITIEDEDLNLVGGEISYDVDTDTVTFDPDDNFANSTTYLVTVMLEVTDLAGNQLTADNVWLFTTEN